MSWALNSGFWWGLRRLWHMPNHFHGTVFASLPTRWDPYYWEEGFRGEWKDILHSYRRNRSFFFEDLKQIIRCVFWKIMYLQPFSCKGNRKCWQTRFCEYLEDQARQAEYLHYPEND